MCTDRFQNYQLLIKEVSNALPEWKLCAEGDANGKQGYYEIDCTNAACCRGKTVRLGSRTGERGALAVSDLEPNSNG